MDVGTNQYKRKGGKDMDDKMLITIFCDVDDFCTNLENYYKHYLMECDTKTSINPSKTLCLSEIMTIVVCFHLSNYRTFKAYYNEYVSILLRGYFPVLVSYNRFVELIPKTLVPLLLYMAKHRVGKCTGISFIDSTTLDV
jgi:hypothetical protein